MSFDHTYFLPSPSFDLILDWQEKLFSVYVAKRISGADLAFRMSLARQGHQIRTFS